MFFNKKVALLFLVCFLFLVNCNKVFAETEIFEGSILDNTIWDKNGSPYLVYSSINVASGTILTIDPGVIVKFDIWRSIRVLGNLVVNGSPEDKVYFTSLYDDSIGGDSDNDGGQYEPDYDDWGGIFVSNGSSYSIKNAEISYAKYLFSSGGSIGTIDSTLFKHSFSGLSFSNGSKSEIKNSQIYDVLGGREANDNVLFSVWTKCDLTLDNVTVDNVPYASLAVAHSSSSLKVSNSKFSNIRGGFDSHTNSYVSVSNSIMENLQSKIRAIFPVHFSSSMDISSSTIDGMYDNSQYQSVFQVSNSSHLTFTDSSLKNITGKDCSISFEAFDGGGGNSTSTLNIKNSFLSDGDCTGLEISGKTETSIENTKINNFAEEGLSAFLSPKINISGSEISDNNSGIISLGADLEIKNSNISNNDIFGIYNDSKENTPIIKATENWWGDKSGPYNDILNASGTGNKVFSNVDFTPWLEYNPIPGEKKNPVIIVPGILSSYLNKNDYTNEEVWMNLVQAALLPYDRYLDDLIMTEFGKVDMTKTQILPTDIFRRVQIANLLDKDFFDGLIKSLEADGYVEGTDLFVFPYDWRLDIRDSVNNTPSPLTVSLKDKIDQILTKTSSEKVDIVAHSMGGLLSKYYLKNFGQGKVGKFIDIATPHFGAPSAFGTLISGDSLGIKLGPLGLNPNEVKKIVQNMPSAYQLLPSQSYFSDGLSDYNYYIDDLEDYDNNGTKGKLSFEESNNFLKNTGRNSYILDNSISIHDDIDNMNSADYGVEVYNIVGCGLPTMGKFFTLGKQSDKDPEFDIAYISGDGTVPQRSAEGILSSKQYYVTGSEHPMIPSSLGVKSLIPLLLSSKQESFDFNLYKNISTTTDECKLPNGTFLSFHSPVDVNIYDESGNHAGPNTSGDLDLNIPGITYDVFENNKFVFLPEGQNYQIKLQSTDSGSFSSHIKKIENGEIISTSYFNDIPLLSTSTKAEVKIGGSSAEIVLDALGDGVSEKNFIPSAVLVGDSLSDRNAPETELKVVSPTLSLDGSYKGNVVINFNATDTESGLLKTEYSMNGIDYFEATSTIIISERGEIKIFYHSVDKAGNIENPKEIILYITDPVKVSRGRRAQIKSDLADNIETATSTQVTASNDVIDTSIVLNDKPKAEAQSMISTTTQIIIPKDITNKKLAVLPKIVTPSDKQKSSPKTPKVENKSSLVKNIQPATVLLSNEGSSNSFFSSLFKRVKDSLISFGKKLFKM